MASQWGHYSICTIRKKKSELDDDKLAEGSEGPLPPFPSKKITDTASFLFVCLFFNLHLNICLLIYFEEREGEASLWET